jgi:hypothetical protein
MALDHLGVIAARIRSSMLKAMGADGDGFLGLKTLDEVHLMPVRLSVCLSSCRSCPARPSNIWSGWQLRTKI